MTIDPAEREARALIALRYEAKGWVEAAAFVRAQAGDAREQVAVDLLAAALRALGERVVS